jgi:hypothetical protein
VLSYGQGDQFMAPHHGKQLCVILNPLQPESIDLSILPL